MKTDDLNYDLPPELIAQTPARERKMSRLLVLERRSGFLSDCLFSDLIHYLNAGDCLVLNNTKVIPARFYARKPSGAGLEGLFLQEDTPGQWQVLLKNSRKINSGDTLEILDRRQKTWCSATAIKTGEGGQWTLTLKAGTGTTCLRQNVPVPVFIDAPAALEQIGFAPLPPYIKRTKTDFRTDRDLQRYQTVYAQEVGAIAAPTAGLHFDQPFLKQIQANGIRLAYITLHVGLGTFRPIQTETLDEHLMHEERYEIGPEAAAIINQTAQASGRVIAVGTTSVRTLETVAKNRHVHATSGKTRLFIQPGYKFQIVDAMVTNFHLPKSTLLALVGAFAGMDTLLKAYHHAIQQKYRFYSYGDAMFIY